jgi:endothelin-converting enzyme
LIVDPSLGKAPKAPAGDVAAQRNIKKLQDLFTSCMDEAAILKAGRKPLVDEIHKLVKSLSASGAHPDKKTLAKALGQIAQYGFQTPGFIKLEARVDYDNPAANVLTIYENGLGLWNERDYKDAGKVKEYQGTIAAMLQTILGDEDVTNRAQPLTSKDINKEWTDAAKDIVDFEVQIAAINTPQSDLWDSTKNKNPRTIDQLNALTPAIDWSVFFKEAFPLGLKYTDPIIVSSLPYLTKLDTLLQKTSSRTLQRYFSWVLIRSLSGNLAQPYKQPKTNFDNMSSGTSPNTKTERWTTCLAIADKNLVHITGHYFVKTTFKGDSRQEVLKIVDNVIASYEKTFPTLSWLDKKTREGALKKLRAIVKTVGYSTSNPDDVSANSLDAFYKGYKVVEKDHFGNQLRYMRWATASEFAQLPLPVDREALGDMSLTTVNAHYYPVYNAIHIPAGILQLPFFNIENPEYVNYGSMGVVGGHEIGVSSWIFLFCCVSCC